MDWLIRVYNRAYQQLVLPFLESYDPPARVALGASIGIFLGLTPTMGIQMYLVSMVWILCRYLLRVRFNLTIGVALVWVSNPITVVPIYFTFLITGQYFQVWTGGDVIPVSYGAFQTEMLRLMAGSEVPWYQWIYYATEVLILEYGWPMLLGSMIFAVPISLFTYPFTYAMIRHYRRILAESQGFTYAQWRERFELKD